MSFRYENILKVKHYAAGATGSGNSSSDPAGFTAGDIMAILEGTVIEGVDVIIKTAVTGSSPQINVGDDDSANGFVADANVTEGTPAVYSGAGSYVSTGAKKYYSAAGKEVKLALGGTVSAGAFAVVVKGYRI